LYCDKIGGERHLQAQFTLNTIGVGLIKLLAPILPHLSSEFVSHHPILRNQPESALQDLLCFPESPRHLFVNENVNEKVEFAQQLRSLVVEQAPKNNDFPKLASFFNCLD
jgi:isoleucyl-tRNA synthetase